MDIINWGWMNHTEEGRFHRDSIKKEIFDEKIYEKHFTVNSGDTVVDVGASIGVFTKSILYKKPKLVLCFEPSYIEFPTLLENVHSNNVLCFNYGIGDDLFIESNEVFGYNEVIRIPTLTLKQIRKNILTTKIDFIKMDCEGCEYNFFDSADNRLWVMNSIKHLVGEFHLNTSELKHNFRKFRDSFLRQLNYDNYHIYSVDGIDIKWDLFNEHFITYYNQVIIHIKIN